MKFGGREDEVRAAATRRVKELAREVCAAGAHDVVVVSELTCADPGCPPVETVVLVVGIGPPRQIKVPRPIVDVTEADLRDALRMASRA